MQVYSIPTFGSELQNILELLSLRLSRNDMQSLIDLFHFGQALDFVCVGEVVFQVGEDKTYLLYDSQYPSGVQYSWNEAEHFIKLCRLWLRYTL